MHVQTMHFVIVSVNAHKNSYEMDGIAVTTISTQANKSENATLRNENSGLRHEPLCPI